MPVADVHSGPSAVNPRRGLFVPVIQRLLLAVVGGYWLTAGLVSLGALALAAVMPRSEAVVLMAMLGFVVYLVLLLWAFAELRLTRLWLMLGGGPLVLWAVQSVALLGGGGHG